MYKESLTIQNKTPKIEYVFLFSQNYFAHNLKRGNFFILLLFFKARMNCVFTFGGKKNMFLLHKVHKGEEWRKYYPSCRLLAFFCTLFFFSKRKRVRVEKIRNWQKCIGVAILHLALCVILEPEHSALHQPGKTSTTEPHSLC